VPGVELVIVEALSNSQIMPIRPTRSSGRKSLEWAMAESLSSESFSARLANIVLPEAGGQQIHLGSLWETSPAVLVFLRHYG